MDINENINLPTIPPTDTEFEPVFVYIPQMKDEAMQQTGKTNKRILNFLKDMQIIPPEFAKEKKLKELKQDAEEREQKRQKRVAAAAAAVETDEIDIRDIDAVNDLLDKNKYGDALPEYKPPFKFSGKIPIPSYYMNNRKMFIQFINRMFEEYRLKLLENTDPITCDNVGKTTKMELMTHQKLIRDYLNLYTPYRGLLLIHGLGSGKTCSSIGIAEGFRNERKIIVMTPAYLQSNYISEIKKCGDMLYRLKQHWTFIPLDLTKAKKREKEKEKEKENKDEREIAQLLGLPHTYIKKHGGFWLMDIKKSDNSNYDSLTDAEKKQLDEQLDIMIHNKYSFINYNGITETQFNKLTNSLKTNIFDNSIVIIDEVHNFVSWIVNKINQTKNYATMKKPPMAISFYKMLMEAQRCRIVMLSGTPVMNYPNEVSVLFNILRGYIYTFTFTIDDAGAKKQGQIFDTKYFTHLLTHGLHKKTSSAYASDTFRKMVDYVQYNQASKTLTITRNPLDFADVEAQAKAQEKNEYEGVKRDTDYAMDFADFKKNIVATLNAAGFRPTNFKMVKNLALPDKLDDFNAKYLDLETREIKYIENFKRRIVGLVSYFRSADEALLPAFDKTQDIHPVYIDMSDLQFGIYSRARIEERKSERGAQLARHMKGIYEGDQNSTSSYRIYSRLFCNFVFPPTLLRPIPAKKGNKKDADENTDADAKDVLEEKEEEVAAAAAAETPAAAAAAKTDERKEEPKEDLVGMTGDKQYNEKIRQVLDEIAAKKEEYLRMPHLLEYSPKYAKILDNIRRLSGKHLVYSQFRTMEGIGLFSLTLDANGFQQFRIRRAHGSWELDMDERELGKKPMYGLYTGTEDKEEREIIRHIFNGNREQTPKAIQDAIDRANVNNIYGDIIKVFMITASGSEGINLMETRYVHIMEPFWHKVRTEQVIGRARRICSHKNLPLEDQTVEVFLYMMQFTKKQLADAPEINKHDVGLLPENRNRPLTSDEKLFETGAIKEQINSKLLLGMKEASIDCAVYTKNNSQEGIQCFRFPNAKPNEFIYNPDYTTDPDIIAQKRRPQQIQDQDQGKDATTTAQGPATATAKMVARIIQDRDKRKYVHDPRTQEVYEYETYGDRRTRKRVGVINEETGHIVFDKA